MNILPHKSWHVYNKANIERVRRDEAKAAEEDKKKKDRADQAESEARLQLLRKRADQRLPIADQGSGELLQAKHINLFHDYELKDGKNEEAETEKKLEEEKLDKRFTMYLDKGTDKADEPWYVKLDRKDEKYVDPYKFVPKQERKRKSDGSSTGSSKEQDPLWFIKESLKKKRDKVKRSKRQHDRHKEDDHRPQKKKRSDKKDSNSSTSAGPTLEELRARRYARERKEKARLQSLFLESQEEQEEDADERKRGYNSQFNREETDLANSKRRRRQR